MKQRIFSRDENIRFIEMIKSTHRNNRDFTTRKSIRKKLIDWSKRSTSHGFPNIFRTKNMCVKIMWGTFFFLFLCLGIYMVFIGIEEYLQYDVTTKIRVIEQNSLVFPTVSICNLNPFVTDTAHEFVIDHLRSQYGPELDSLHDVIRKNEPYNQQFDTDIRLMKYRIAEPSFDANLRESFGLPDREFLYMCHFNTKKCDYEQLEHYYDPYYGNCFKFNSGIARNGSKIPSKVLNRLSFHGLRLVLFVGTPHSNVSRFFLSNRKFHGVRLAVHNKNTRPNFKEGIFLKTGTYNLIKLNKIVTEALPAPYSECHDLSTYKSIILDLIRNSSYAYRQTDCLNMCLQLNIIKKCGCYDLFYPNLFNATPCLSLTQYECMMDNYFDFYKYEKECNKLCPLECKSTTYDLKMSTSGFPSPDYAEILKLDSRIIDLYAPDYVDNLTNDLFEKSLLALEIYFDEIKYTSITEQPTVTKFDLISNIGGTLGLFIGISLMSFLELLEIIIEIITVLIYKR